MAVPMQLARVHRAYFALAIGSTAEIPLEGVSRSCDSLIARSLLLASSRVGLRWPTRRRRAGSSFLAVPRPPRLLVELSLVRRVWYSSPGAPSGRSVAVDLHEAIFLLLRYRNVLIARSARSSVFEQQRRGNGLFPLTPQLL